jgi:hypothetical protein
LENCDNLSLPSGLRQVVGSSQPDDREPGGSGCGRAGLSTTDNE